MLVRCHSISGSSLPEMSRVIGETDETDFSPLCAENNYNVLFFSR